MGRKVGSTNKKTQSNSTEVVEKKPSNRGRKPGQVIEKEKPVVLELNKKNRIKMDKLNNIWQQKIEKDDEVNPEDNEDQGWKTMGYYRTGLNGVADIAIKLRDNLVKQKAKKEMTISAERYVELINKANSEVIKIFAPLGLTITKNERR